jgi:hypothetical protein
LVTNQPVLADVGADKSPIPVGRKHFNL